MDHVARRLRIRARASLLIAAAGIVNLVSALTPSLRARLHWLLAVLPLGIPQGAAAGVALAGILLCVLAAAVRRGNRRAWGIALGLLAISAVLHLLKGLDVEESALTAGVAAYLVVHRQSFRTRSDERRTRVALLLLAAGAAVTFLTALAGVELLPGPLGRLPFPRAVLAVVSRMAGIPTPPLSDTLDYFLTPVLATLGAAIVVVAAWLALRPAVDRRHHDRSDHRRARRIVARYGADSLAYFALRHDKRWFFWGDTVVAYAVFGSVCLVSPDPVGPPAERQAAWLAFRGFADEQGWALAVLGAAEDWLPVYRASGMREMYIGDEAVVDCMRFSLEGGRFKSLRQAVNRIARYGYRARFYNPAYLDPALRAQLSRLAASSRRGKAERGFSMTLGRLFDPDDTGLLLTVVFGPDGRPAAFCQFVPAPGIGGWSLDVMRRDRGPHPNGLLDFAIVETIRYMRERGERGLALNFATMRAVLARETGNDLAARTQRWLLTRLSASMQIESLWHYNAKFDPDWRPRYACYDARDRIVPAALAVARAESFWELPVVGRFIAAT